MRLDLTFTRTAALCLAVIVSGAVRAQTGNRNAATWFQRAIDQYNRSFTQQQREAVEAYLEHPNTPPTPEVRDIIGQAQGLFTIVRRGSAMEYCDFGLDRNQGFEMTLPHLSPLRGIGKLMSADALIHLQDGDSAGAAMRTSDMYRLSGRFGDDRILISSLVGQSMFNLAERTLQSGIDRGAFNAADSAAVLTSVKTLPQTDPFEYVEAVAGEQEMAIDYLSKKFLDAEKWHELPNMLSSDPNDPETQKLLALSADDFKSELDKYDSYMTKIVEAFSISDPEQAKAKVGELEKQVENGDAGVLAHFVMPAFGRCLDKKLEGEKLLADRIAVLQGMAKGEATIEDTANAAVWYLRGIELMERTDAAKLQAIRDFAADPSMNMTDELAKTLASSVEIMDYFRLASRMRRCDFKSAREPDELALAPAYEVGMHDGLRMLQAEAVRNLRAGSKDEAAADLNTCLSVCAHLGCDPVLTSALVAHLDFNRTMSLTRQAFEAGIFDDSDKKAIAIGLDRVSRRDPFGYIGAVIESRKTLEKRFDHRNPRDEEQKNRWAAIAEEVKAWNADQLMFVATILDTLSRAAQSQQAVSVKPEAVATSAPAGDPKPDPAKVAPVDPMSKLADVLSLSQIDAARSEVVRIAPLLAQDDWSVFADARGAPMIALPNGVVDRMRYARADLRRAMSLLKPLPQPSEAKPGAAATMPDEPESPE